MTTPKLKITNIDAYGFLGRDFHPGQRDLGLTVTLLGAVAWCQDNHLFNCEVVDDRGRVSAKAVRYLASGNKDPRGQVYWVFTCLTEDGRLLELIDHEVEWFIPAPVDLPHGVFRGGEEDDDE